MKKLSLLVALLLCVTIGGVYATWYYTGSENVPDVSEPISINLEDAGDAGAHGQYTLEVKIEDPTLVTFFRIDQADDHHNAKIVSNGSVKLVFIPSVHATTEIKSGNFPTWIYFTGNIGELTYNGAPIFKDIQHNGEGNNKIQVDWTPNAETGNLECNITEYVINELQLVEAGIRLPSLADYNNFAAAIASISFSVHVTDGIVANN